LCVVIGGALCLFIYERGYQLGQTKEVQPIQLPKQVLPHREVPEKAVTDEWVNLMSYTGDLPKEGEVKEDGGED
jgi:hypothetical protein